MSKRAKDEGLSGLLGDEIIVRKVNGRIHVRTVKPRRKSKSKLVAKIHERFRAAAKYAKAQVANPEIRALYATRVNRRTHTPYLVALSDYLNAPVVDAIDASTYRGNAGATIEIEAHDDFMVTEVKVAIKDPAGNIIERGQAQDNGKYNHKWIYQTTVANAEWQGTVIHVVAYDRAGNKGVREVKV